MMVIEEKEGIKKVVPTKVGIWLDSRLRGNDRLLFRSLKFFIQLFQIFFTRIICSLKNANIIYNCPSILRTHLGCIRRHQVLSDHHGVENFSIGPLDRKSTRLNSSHSSISYAVFCLTKQCPSSTA